MVTRKQYTKEFKLDAISLVLNQCLKRYIAREVYYILRKRNNLINSTQIAA